MPQKCTVCNHPNTAEIEQRIVEGVAHTTIADQFGLNHLAIRRHSEMHLPEKLVRHVRENQSNQAEGILDGISDLLDRTKNILDKAEAKGHQRLALDAIKEARGTYELLSKIAVKLEEYKRRDGQEKDELIDEQIQEGLAALTTSELKTFVHLQTKILSANPDYQLDPASRFMVDSIGYDEIETKLQGIERRNRKQTESDSLGTRPKEPKNNQKYRGTAFEDESDDFDLELDDLSLDSTEEFFSEQSEPEWLQKWRKDNPSLPL